jgi:hypothetical protein
MTGPTYGLIVLPSEYVHPEGTVRFIFFEHSEGENFLPENTRYQSWTDIPEPPFPIVALDSIDLENVTLFPETE